MASGSGNRDQQDQRALEEYRQLEAIITHVGQEGFKVRGWLLVLLSALLAALYSDKTKLNGLSFGGLSGLLALFFAFAELVSRVTKRKALQRAAIVEAALRGEVAYDGPKICDSLSTSWDMKTLVSLMRDEAQLITVWGFYLPIWLIVLLLAMVNL